ncbi:hypothetical protein LJR230_002210 [Trinickia sp. LjRoot230]|uniref:hypothetical protein n=1 Tax=Trinickia sp. LjRoot230 TaxID=3342288 RepID=UPI003ECCD0E4
MADSRISSRSAAWTSPDVEPVGAPSPAETITNKAGKRVPSWRIAFASGEQNIGQYGNLPTYDIPIQDWGDSLQGPAAALFKKAYVYAPRPDLAIVMLGPQFQHDLLYRELRRYSLIASHNLPVLNIYGIVHSNNQIGMLCERFAEGSKDILLRHKRRV